MATVSTAALHSADEAREQSCYQLGMASSSPSPGRFCREIHVTIEPGRAIGELVDDFHHFRATIEFEAGTITSVVGEALRIPW